jgi:hypothetical protein
LLKKGYTFAYWFRCNFESIYIEHSMVATFSHDFSPCMVSSRNMFLALQICTSDFPIPMWYILHRIRQKSDRMSLLVRCGQIIFDNINVCVCCFCIWLCWLYQYVHCTYPNFPFVYIVQWRSFHWGNEATASLDCFTEFFLMWLIL